MRVPGPYGKERAPGDLLEDRKFGEPRERPELQQQSPPTSRRADGSLLFRDAGPEVDGAERDARRRVERGEQPVAQVRRLVQQEAVILNAELQHRVARKHMRSNQPAHDTDVGFEDGDGDVGVEVEVLPQQPQRAPELRGVAEDHERGERVDERQRVPPVVVLVTSHDALHGIRRSWLALDGVRRPRHTLRCVYVRDSMAKAQLV